VRFVEVQPDYFRQVDANFGLAFREDDRGRITHLFTDLTPMYAFEKLNWYETPIFNMALLGVCVLLFLSMIPVAVIRAIRNRRLSAAPKPALRGARVAYWIIVGICVLNLLFVAGTYLWGDARPMYGVSTIFQVVLDWACWGRADRGRADLRRAGLEELVLGPVTRVYYTL